MKFGTSIKSGIVRPHISKGYYPACLVGIRVAKTKDGKLLENKFGGQLALDWAIYDFDKKTNTVTTPVTFTVDNIEREAIIGQLVNYEYKNEKTGKKGTAFTPKSRPTAIFKALGWEGPKTEGGEFDPEQFKYCWAELNVNDYEKDGVTTSSIQDVGVLKAKVPVELTEQIKKERAPVGEAVTEEEDDEELSATEEDVGSAPSIPSDSTLAKITDLEKQLADGDITQQGFDRAVAQLRGKKA